MKIKSLIAIAVLLMGSPAYAQIAVDTKVSYGDVQFNVTKNVSDEKNPNTYEVQAISVLKDKAATLSIPASFTKTDLTDVTSTFKVVSFANTWATAGKNVSETLKTLTIDAENMATISKAGKELKALESLTVSTTKWPNDGYINSFLTADTKKTLTTLNLSGMTAVKDLGAYYAVTGEGVLDKLTSVTLPANLETIAAGAFAASKVTSIELPASLKEIGDQAFEKSALTGLNLNANVNLEKIGEQAFNECKDLAKLQMSGIAKGKLEEIGAYAFAETAITAANIPATVTTLGEGAFENCAKLTQVSAMAGLVAIPKVAFGGCEALAKVSIGEDVASIGESAFEGCKALESVTFKGEKVATIGKNAFKDCESLTEIDLSTTGVTIVASTWFEGCSSLATVTLGDKITAITKDAFKDCAIETLDLSKTKITQLRAIFGTNTAEAPNTTLTSITLPEGCLRIFDEQVFAYCTALETVNLPTTLEYYTYINTVYQDEPIAAKTFYYCTSLTTVNYKPTVTIYDPTFDGDAFLGCTPFVHIVTNTYYTANNSVAPQNATYGAAGSDKVKTVADKGTSGKFFAKLCPKSDVRINADDAKVYSVYLDGGNAYFQAAVKRNGKYTVYAGDHAIIKTDEEKEISLEINGGAQSIYVDDIVNANNNADVPTAVFQETMNAGEYLYRLTNNAATGGFGFTFFSGDTMKEGQFFIVSKKKPAGAGRLNIVWLDENGFVEEDGATAIQKVEAAEAENGAIYNLQGVRVNAAKKGLYIQNGKKYIMK